MSDLYKNLKTLRKEKGISLEDINKRTKINISTLKAIESGDLSSLTRPYQRLFIIAYAAEIGANPEDIIKDSEESIELKRKPVDQTKDSIEKSALKPEIKKNSVEISSNKRSAKHMRKDIIMGSVLIAILIFAIYIIRLINEEETKTRTKETSQYYEDEPLSKIFIEGDEPWEEILFDNFDILSESLQALDSSAPFTFRIATAERLWYRYEVDSLKALESVIPRGDNHQYSFNHSFKILFGHSNTLNIFLNDYKIKNLKSSAGPVLLNISYPNKTLTLQHFVSKL
jgi:transcriptional regulator with XRE-family HTH domain|tara:strand:+ start:2217 stop:3071 length:855 start_codon:yes stop_codon:yes gene_type:complete